MPHTAEGDDSRRPTDAVGPGILNAHISRSVLSLANEAALLCGRPVEKGGVQAKHLSPVGPQRT
jgi:hypothetical protein